MPFYDLRLFSHILLSLLKESHQHNRHHSYQYHTTCNVDLQEQFCHVGHFACVWTQDSVVAAAILSAALSLNTKSRSFSTCPSK